MEPSLQKALAIYGAAQDGAGDTPIHDKSELVRQLREAISTTTTFCLERRIDPAKIRDARGFEREKLKEDAVAAFVVKDVARRQYLNLAGSVDSIFKSLLPDASAFEFSPITNVFKVVTFARLKMLCAMRRMGRSFLRERRLAMKF